MVEVCIVSNFKLGYNSKGQMYAYRHIVESHVESNESVGVVV
jgi:hypothetical protein